MGGEVEVLHSAGDGQLIFEQRDFAVGGVVAGEDDGDGGLVEDGGEFRAFFRPVLSGGCDEVVDGGEVGGEALAGLASDD